MEHRETDCETFRNVWRNSQKPSKIQKCLLSHTFLMTHIWNVQQKCHSCTDNTSPYARMRTFLSLRVRRHKIHPMHLHWVKMFGRFCVSLQNHPIRAPCHSWVFLSSLRSLLSLLRLPLAFACRVCAPLLVAPALLEPQDLKSKRAKENDSNESKDQLPEATTFIRRLQGQDPCVWFALLVCTRAFSGRVVSRTCPLVGTDSRIRARMWAGAWHPPTLSWVPCVHAKVLLRQALTLRLGAHAHEC